MKTDEKRFVTVQMDLNDLIHEMSSEMVEGMEEIVRKYRLDYMSSGTIPLSNRNISICFQDKKKTKLRISLIFEVSDNESHP